jgi:hypothetical protein
MDEELRRAINDKRRMIALEEFPIAVAPLSKRENPNMYLLRRASLLGYGE